MSNKIWHHEHKHKNVVILLGPELGIPNVKNHLNDAVIGYNQIRVKKQYKSINQAHS